MTHTTLQILLIGLLLFFVAVNIIVEYLRRNADNWLEQPLSAYLTGHYGWLQSLAYSGFSLGLWLSASYFSGAPIQHYAFIAASIAMWFVVLTKWAQLQPWGITRRDMLEHLHVISAGVAYLGTSLGLLLATHGTALEWGMAVPVGVLLVIVFCWHSIETAIVRLTGTLPEQSVIEEKGYTMALLAVFLLTLVTVRP